MPNYCLSSLFVYSSTNPHSIDYTPNGTPYWAVGDSFLKNIYSVFNLGSGGNGDAGIQGMGSSGSTAQVGFATPSRTNGEIGLSCRGGDGTTPADPSGNEGQRGMNKVNSPILDLLWGRHATLGTIHNTLRKALSKCRVASSVSLNVPLH